MTVDEMLAGDEWKLLIDDAPADLARCVTFECGTLRESGVEVGTYQVDGSLASGAQPA